MVKSPKPIIQHIPLFLDYCKKEKKHSGHTLENYSRYLKKFIVWLKQTNNESLLPYELEKEHISLYRLYLSRFQDEKGNRLKRSTQNYYLIALRALLSYFSAKDIVSLLPSKITLKRAKLEKKSCFLTTKEVEKTLPFV